MFKRKAMTILVLFVLVGGLIGDAWAAPPQPDDLGLLAPSADPCPYADEYEDDGGSDRDDSFATASTLTTDGQPGHTFDRDKDKDWAKFEAQAGYLYTIATENLTPLADTVLELYGPDGVTLIEGNDDGATTVASQIEWYARQSGTYFVKIYNYPPSVFGCDVGYDLTLVEDSALRIAKFAEDLNGAPLLEGDVIRYTVTVTNASTTIQFTNVVITDPIPSGTTFVPDSVVLSKGLVLGTTPVLEARVGTMDPGEVVTAQFDVQVAPGTGGQDVVNQAYVRCDQMGIIGSLPAAPAGGGRVEPGLSIDKTAIDVDGPPVLAGDRISYTIVVTNESTIPHTNVVITDFIPSGTTYVDGSATVPPGSLLLPVDQTLVATMGALAPAAGVRIDFAVTVDDGVEQIGGNVAVVSSDQQNAKATDPVYPPSEQSLGLAKGAKDVNGGPLYPGDEIQYTVVVANLLQGPQTNVVITDAIPNYTTYVAGSASLIVNGVAVQGGVSGPDPLVADVGTFQAGEKAVLTFRVTVDGDATGQVIGNSAQASSDQQVPPVSVGPVEPAPGGGTVRDGQQALGITKTAEDWNGGPLYPGDEILYTISVVNLLTTTQQNVTISDTIPNYTTYVAGSAVVSPGVVTSTDPVMANVGALGPGQKAVLTFRVTVDTGATGQVVENRAQASSDAQSPAVFTPPVQPYPDPLPGYPDSGGGWVLDGDQQIGIRKLAADVDGAPLNPNDTISYTVVIWNEVAISQTNVVITDYVPDFTTYVAGSVTTTKGTPSGPDPLLVDVGTLDVSERVTVTFQVTVDGSATGQTITNRAWVGSDQQVPQAYTPPVTTPDGGTVVALAGPGIYLPCVRRDA
jgi:uncharacterized repeat protein (TIGR01451 family)